MDVAYDHIQEESFSPHEEKSESSTGEPSSSSSSAQQQSNLNTEFQQAFKAVSSSPWGARLGDWFGEARKQGQAFVSDLQKEATEAQQQATKGFTQLQEQLAQRTRGMSLNAEGAPQSGVPGEEAVPEVKKEGEVEGEKVVERPESLPADILKEAGSLVASLRMTAGSRLKDLQKAEDAADEALLKFGSNVRNFLRDAVVISAPTEGDASKPKGKDMAGNEVLFETTEQATGKKVFHTTRLDAQLHAIHTTAASFTDGPQGEQWQQWDKEFDIDKQTEAIAKDLEKYEELRNAMEQLVPEKVEYKNFWMRYYFLRKAVEEDEKRRKELLKGAAANTEEEVGWDESDDEAEPSEEKASTPHATSHPASASTTTLNASAANDLLSVKAPRKSNEDEAKSVADSDASYDLVSGATSRAPGSPKEEKKTGSGKDEESDDDWE